MLCLKRNRFACLRMLTAITMCSTAVLYGVQQFTQHRNSESLRQLENMRKERFLSYQSSETLRKGPGEYNEKVVLTKEEEAAGIKAVEVEAFNRVISDKISLERAHQDTRPSACRSVSYSTELPKASVIIIFHNEAWSALLRTVYSVINRSPPQYLHEVILLDDCSDKAFLGADLDSYVAKTWPDGVVKIVRLQKRAGLIRARIRGAEAATGDVIIFLDSHCETNVGWIEPMLSRIKEKRTAVLVPVMDVISKDDLRYDGRGVAIGGFVWPLLYFWINIPDSELKRRTSDIDPVRSPTMAGGLFAMDRKYFFELGTYDEQMEVWGGENLEISFRIWMCGGSLEAIPCSHVGHIFRSHHPYSFLGQKDPHGINSKRFAEVWMDDYKRLFYTHRPDLIDAEYGDVSERKALRQRLKCHSFKWFLDNVYPQKFIPDENVQTFGQVKNNKTGLCFDTLQNKQDVDSFMGYYQCHHIAKGTQLISLDKENVLRTEDTCLHVPGIVNGGEFVTIGPCVNDKKKHIAHWRHDKLTGSLKEEQSGLCIDVDKSKSDKYIVLNTCDGRDSQTWHMDYTIKNS